MIKTKERRKQNRKPQVTTQVVQQSSNKVLLQKLLPSFTASFETVSKVYQASNMNLEIPVDNELLRSLVDRVHDDDAKAFAAWIERFAEVCKDLGKYQGKLHEEYAARWEQTNSLGQMFEARELELAAQQAELEQRDKSLEHREITLAHEESQQVQKNSELLNRDREIKRREINADADFAEQNMQALRALEERQKVLKKEHETLLEKLQGEKQTLDGEIRKAARQLAEIKYNCSEAEIERVQKLDEREYELNQQQRKVDTSRSRMDREWADLKEAKNDYQQSVADEMALERNAHRDEVSKLNDKLENAWSKVQDLKDQLADLRELRAALGEQSAGDIIDQLASLREQNRDLRRSLDQSDTAEVQQENEYLRNRVADLERDIADMRPELDKVHRELSVKRVSATELEAVAREKRVLEQHKNTLSVHIDDLESRIDQLTNAQKTQTPFPAMSLMDSDKDYRSRMEQEDVPGLKQFAVELQHRIAHAEDKVRLYYPLEDIRILLGGLAMSQLHVFQGISGTGKTSLAKAFAKAMGGSCTDIAVQAGWRDRDDLLGHYNAFERRFYEKDTLQALYKAQTPRWEDSCNVVLLDEMNLSRPEQYFAEFLSALEKNNPDERLISLSETALPNAPAMLRDGRKILVPSNVWFIGTANHDETTSELADKTYDRAHVMTLPKQDHRFEIQQMNETSYSFRSLQRAFDKACTTHKAAISKLLDGLTEHDFTKQLESHFGLGWGNRFEKQALRFVPVMLETGASSGQALDHLLSTRVMRAGKVTGRYDVVADDLRKLQGALENFWMSTNLDGAPDKSICLLESDIRRLEGGV
ncbi:MAG: AAA family ATPase [Motiliproteus sp.]|nr:AAA family ATPase [Motiliproteus sp.]MCW9053244.1 AAA family ATPase [Motiliproteus sp.]